MGIYPPTWEERPPFGGEEGWSGNGEGWSSLGLEWIVSWIMFWRADASVKVLAGCRKGSIGIALSLDKNGEEISLT